MTFVPDYTGPRRVPYTVPFPFEPKLGFPHEGTFPMPGVGMGAFPCVTKGDELPTLLALRHKPSGKFLVIVHKERDHLAAMLKSTVKSACNGWSQRRVLNGLSTDPNEWEVRILGEYQSPADAKLAKDKMVFAARIGAARDRVLNIWGKHKDALFPTSLRASSLQGYPRAGEFSGTYGPGPAPMRDYRSDIELVPMMGEITGEWPRFLDAAIVNTPRVRYPTVEQVDRVHNIWRAHRGMAPLLGGQHAPDPGLPMRERKRKQHAAYAARARGRMDGTITPTGVTWHRDPDGNRVYHGVKPKKSNQRS